MRSGLGVPLVALLLCAGTGLAQEEGLVPADRIVAVVDDDPILSSDLERAITLGLTRREPEEDDSDFERRTLDRLIDERLRFHEMARYGFQELPLAEVDQRFTEIRSSFASRSDFERALTEVGLDATELREILARRLLVDVFVEERLGPRVLISRDSIVEYYEEVLRPDRARRGEPLPELGKVREEIRHVLRQQRLNEELDRWTAELRARASILDYLDEHEDELPPIVE